MAATLLVSSSVSAQASVRTARDGAAATLELSLSTEFRSEFGMTTTRFDRKVRRLRAVGWTMFGLFGTGFIITPFLAEALEEPYRDDGPGLFIRVFGWTASSLVGLLSAIPLIRARVLVNRRRRWRETHGLSWDIRLRPGGLDWRLTF